MQNIIIRPEQPTDFPVIDELVRASFATAEHTDGNEYKLVKNLRVGETYIPELALVAVYNKEIIGYIMLTTIKIGESTELALAPLAVSPSYQKQGVGSKLITAAHAKAKQLGYHYSIVLGNEKYYPRFGYVQADSRGIIAPFDVPRENFMLCVLQQPSEKIQGVVQYPCVFFT